MQKSSIRFYNNTPVRSVYDDQSSSWYSAATDLVKAFTDTTNPRVYWATIKRRNSQLFTGCKQLKLTASDGKQYLTECLSADEVKNLISILPSNKKETLLNWIKGSLNPIDEQSKAKAYELFSENNLGNIEEGTVKGLQQIHSFIFDGLFDFAGQIRNKNISKGGFIFANCMFLPDILKTVEKMPETTLDEILDKYIEMNIAHPFMEGNGRATRIWLDLILKTRLHKCVDWSKIEKKDYLSAMELSPIDKTEIKKLISNSLTDKINSREIFMKGIDYSYYYEEV